MSKDVFILGGKRTPMGEYTRHGRGTQGIIAIDCSERNGRLVAAQLVGSEDEIMLITTGGVLIRTRVAEVREQGRSTQGVRLINLDEGEKLAGLEKIVESEEVLIARAIKLHPDDADLKKKADANDYPSRFRK